MDTTLIIATAFTAFGTLVLAGATAYLALKTREMSNANRQMVEINSATLEEMRVSREAQERPYIVVELDYVRRHGFVFVVVRNDGVRAARNLSFQFSAPIWTSTSFDGPLRV